MWSYLSLGWPLVSRPAGNTLPSTGRLVILGLVETWLFSFLVTPSIFCVDMRSGVYDTGKSRGDMRGSDEHATPNNYQRIIGPISEAIVSAVFS